jgi:8-oxo-dGTP pyrophosphatase MutT (NUDIX family)
MEHFKPNVGVFLWLEKGDNSVLFLLRKNTGYMDGFYDFPAGHLEDCESLTFAMIREAKEELDINILPENLKLIHVCQEIGNKLSKDYIRFVFRCIEWDGIPKINEVDKCGGLEWFNVDNLPKNIPYYTKKMVEVIKKRVILSEF